MQILSLKDRKVVAQVLVFILKLLLTHHFGIELFNKLHDIFCQPIMLNANIIHKVKDWGRPLLVLLEVYPVLLVWLDEPLSDKVLLIKLHFVGNDIQNLPILLRGSEKRWHPDSVLFCNRFWVGLKLRQSIWQDCLRLEIWVQGVTGTLVNTLLSFILLAFWS